MDCLFRSTHGSDCAPRASAQKWTLDGCSQSCGIGVLMEVFLQNTVYVSSIPNACKAKFPIGITILRNSRRIPVKRTQPKMPGSTCCIRTVYSILAYATSTWPCLSDGPRIKRAGVGGSNLRPEWCLEMHCLYIVFCIRNSGRHARALRTLLSHHMHRPTSFILKHALLVLSLILLIARDDGPHCPLDQKMSKRGQSQAPISSATTRSIFFLRRTNKGIKIKLSAFFNKIEQAMSFTTTKMYICNNTKNAQNSCSKYSTADTNKGLWMSQLLSICPIWIKQFVGGKNNRSYA